MESDTLTNAIAHAHSQARQVRAATTQQLEQSQLVCRRSAELIARSRELLKHTESGTSQRRVPTET
jgi:hypothetical protein